MADKSKTIIEQTVEYYEKNAEDFVNSTINADMSNLYAAFEKYLFPGCEILDLGCGSGRDSKYFTEKGYIVTAVDPSAEMCASTQKVSGIKAIQMRAEDMQFADEFDAVWACASLLHVRKDDMKQVLCRCMYALRRNGVMYASWKYGKNQRMTAGRHFSDYTEDAIGALLHKIQNIKLIDVWITEDVRAENKTTWTNILIQKK